MYPRIAFIYSLKCRQSFNDNNFTNNVIFLTSIWSLWQKMTIPNPFCASTRQANTRQLDPKLSIAYDLWCIRSSSDKNFFGRSNRQTDRANNNTPELSFESVDITILMRCFKIGYFTVVWSSQISINKTLKFIQFATDRSGLTAANEKWEVSYYLYQ